jgi:hypothetical protein
MAHDQNAVRKILAEARAAKRAALTAPEARGVCEAYGITISTEIPVAVLDAKYQWARGAGLISAT